MSGQETTLHNGRCENFGGAIITFAPSVRRISVNGKVYHFEFHHYCGPVLVTASGDVSKNQQYKSVFWHAVSCWAQQGQRMNGDLCAWNWASLEQEHD